MGQMMRHTFKSVAVYSLLYIVKCMDASRTSAKPMDSHEGSKLS